MNPMLRTVVILLIFLVASVAAAVALHPFSDSEWADGNARLAGAGALCLVFFTLLTAAGKWTRLFPRRPNDDLSPTRSDCNEPLLTGPQTLTLLHLFQRSIVLELLEQLVYVCDAADHGRNLPAQEAIAVQLDTARHEARGALLGLPIPFEEHDLERMYGSADVKKDIAQAYELACDTSKSLELRVRGFLHIAKARSETTLHEYRLRLQKLDIPL